MKSLMITLTLVLLLLQQQQVESATWGYGASNGPAYWPTLVPKWCSGRRQSPIALTQNGATFDNTLVPHLIREPLSSAKYLIKNDGSKFTVDFRGAVNVTMGNDPRSCYKPDSIHWHWGSDSSKGSEHWLEGKQYPIEGHIVMWDCSKYSTFSEAVSGFEGLAVLGVMYEEAAVPDNSAGINAIYNAMSSNMELMRCMYSNCSGVMIDAFSLSSLLPPSDTRSFFMYPGSLTTPDCRENVLWTVYKTPLKVSSAFLQAFRNLRTASNQPMSNNFRTLQELNPARPMGGRRVLTRSFSVSGDSTGIGSSAMSQQPAAAALALVLLFLQLAVMQLR